MVGGTVGQIKVREMRRKRYKSPSPVLDRRSFVLVPIRAVLLRRSGDKRDVLADVPHVIRRPCPLAWGGLGLVSGGVVFPELSKLLNQEDALGAPYLDTVILALRRRALAGAGILRIGVIRHFGVTLRLAAPDIRLASADAFAVVGGGCTGRAHGCKAKQGSRGKDGADVCSYSHSSTVLEPRRERMKNSLVTMSARC